MSYDERHFKEFEDTINICIKNTTGYIDEMDSLTDQIDKVLETYDEDIKREHGDKK